ncbi:hypothetical protein Q3G72_027684 [Acer saccharum]|nr:hypothetical protein Q3G72_027684 [Acer saccharum]
MAKKSYKLPIHDAPVPETNNNNQDNAVNISSSVHGPKTSRGCGRPLVSVPVGLVDKTPHLTQAKRGRGRQIGGPPVGLGGRADAAVPVHKKLKSMTGMPVGRPMKLELEKIGEANAAVPKSKRRSKRPVGRPRKVQVLAQAQPIPNAIGEAVVPKSQAQVQAQPVLNAIGEANAAVPKSKHRTKRPVGRPRKVQVQAQAQPMPNAIGEANAVVPKARRRTRRPVGRPRKVQVQAQAQPIPNAIGEANVAVSKSRRRTRRPVGRPRKVQVLAQAQPIPNAIGEAVVPKSQAQVQAQPVMNAIGEANAAVPKSKHRTKRPVGRPRKVQVQAQAQPMPNAIGEANAAVPKARHRTRRPVGRPKKVQVQAQAQPIPNAIGEANVAVPKLRRRTRRLVGRPRKNTIPSIQVAVSLPPPRTYLSKYDQTSQGVESCKVTPNHVSVSAADIGLPDGGVPPQGAGQPSLPTESFGFPDGGVPPQYSGQAPVPSQSQVQAAQYPISTQPLDLSALGVPNSADSGKPLPQTAAQPTSVRPGQNQLPDALSCFDEVFLALAKDQSRGADIKGQAIICAQYKIAVTLLKEITRLQKVQGASAISAKDEMARLSRHLVSLPLQTKHHINCIRAAIRRNMEVQNYAYFKQMLELLLLKVPASFQEELRSLSLTNKSIDPLEDPSQFCAATLSCMSTIGYDVCDLCGAKFSALSAPGCIICGMGSIKRSDALAGPVPSPSPFG